MNNYFSVGIHKGEWDFSVSGAIYELSYEDMRKLREMTIVGIGVFEDMWRQEQQKRLAPHQAMGTKE